MKIEGRSGGNILEIDVEGQASVEVVIHDEFEHAAERGDAFSWTNVTYDPDAADTIILIRNDHTTKNLHILGFSFNGDTASTIKCHLTDKTNPTPAGTLSIVGVALNSILGGIPLATAFGDETANTQGNIVYNFKIEANKHYDIDLHGAVILGTNNSFAIDYVSAATAAFTTVLGYYKER